MNKFFKGIKTAEELKKAYHKMAVKMHPDNGGNEEEFKAMKAEFEKLWEQLKNTHADKDGNTYEKATDETAAAFMELIEKLIRMPGIVVELCGSWLWVTGNTKDHKDDLKGMGFKWSPKKSAWYFHAEPYRKRGKKQHSLDEIRAMYGIRTFESEQKKIS